VLQTAANAVDTITFKCTGAGAYIGYPTQNLNPTVTTVTAGHYVSQTTGIAIAAGAGAGSSPTVSITGTDTAGYITITTGSSPTASATVATITFNTAYTSTPHSVMITPASSNDSILSGQATIYAGQAGLSTTGFTLTVGSTALAGATTYVVWYHVNG